MLYALVYYPQIADEGFHAFRNQYELYSLLLAEHIPFIFPVPETIGRNKLENHVFNVLSNWKPFSIHISGYQLSWDNWLMMLVNEGNEKIIQLHDDLYSGILSSHLRLDLPYVPHIALGYFADEKYKPEDPAFQSTLNEGKYKIALAELYGVKLDYWRTIDKLTLLAVNEEFTVCREIEEFKLA